MLSILIEKELKGIISSPKFAATFSICTLLLLLSVFIGIQEYKAATRQYETATQLADQQLREANSWRMVQTKVFRKPDPMQIFVSGLSYDIGRWAAINQLQTPKLRSSSYSEDPIFAVFRFIDMAFIVTVVLSLFAILFTYDAISGERESGTLALVFSNALPRARYLLAKGIGAWLGLIAPVALAILLCLLVVMLSGVSFGTEEWLKTLTLIGTSLLYFTCFIVLGLVISALTRHSSVSFLLSLVVWVAFVLIIPRVGVLASGQIVRVPSVAEIEGQRSAFAKDRWARHMKDLEAFWAANNRLDRPDSLTDDEMWARMKRQDSMRNEVEKDIIVYETKLYEDLRRRKAEQERLAFTLSRFSPASAYQLAAMSLAGTDLELKERYEDATNTYRTTFNDYVDTKTAATPGGGGITITFSSDKGMQMNSRDNTELDLSDRPTFEPPQQAFGGAAAGVVVDAGLLGLYSLLAFAGAFFAFHRYDVR